MNESAIEISSEKLPLYSSLFDGSIDLGSLAHACVHSWLFTLPIEASPSCHPPRSVVRQRAHCCRLSRTIALFGTDQRRSVRHTRMSAWRTPILFFKKLRAFFAKPLARIGNSRRPSFRVGVAPPPSCSSPRRDDIRKRARCVWNSGRPDLAQRDSAWLSSRPPPLASVLVGGYTSVSLPLPSVPFSLPLSPSLPLSRSRSLSLFLTHANVVVRPQSCQTRARGGAFLCAALSIDPLPEVSSPSLLLSLGPRPSSPPRILPFLPLCVSLYRIPLLYPRSIIPGPSPAHSFSFAAAALLPSSLLFLSCISLLHPRLAIYRVSPSSSLRGRPLPLSTARFDARATYPFGALPLFYAPLSPFLFVDAVLVCSFLVVVDDDRRHAPIILKV